MFTHLCVVKAVFLPSRARRAGIPAGNTDVIVMCKRGFLRYLVCVGGDVRCVIVLYFVRHYGAYGGAACAAPPWRWLPSGRPVVYLSTRNYQYIFILAYD